MNQVTVLITTSPVRCHPSTEMLHKAVDSIRENLSLDFDLMIVCDGGTAFSHHACKEGKYQEYKQRLRKEFEATIIESDEWIGRAGGLKRAIPKVPTPFVFVGVHDFVLVRKINGPRVLDALERDADVKFVRFNQRKNVPVAWDFRLQERKHSLIPLLKTGCWCDDLSLARTTTWRETILPLLRDQRSSEQCVMGPPGWGWFTFASSGFDAAHARFGSCIYGSLDDEAMARHLNGKTYSVGKTNA